VASAASFPLLVGLSLLAGFIGAISGMGGGVVLVPALTLLGVDAKHAIAASLLSVIATSSGAASAYVRDRLTNLKLGMFLEVFTIGGALLGATITLATGQRLLSLLFGVALLLSWVATALAGREEWVAPAHQDRLSAWLELEGSYYSRPRQVQVDYKATRAYLGGPLMFGVGVIAGLLGIGAGAFKVLIMDLVMGLPPKVSTTTSNLIIGVTALAGTSVYLAAGLVEPGLVAPVILGVVAGAFLGTRLLVRLRGTAVRRVYQSIIVVLALEMLARGLLGY
jgi:uncharacterized protein